MRNYLAELIGTFFLVFTVALAAVAGNAGAFAPLAIGAVLMVMIYAAGHVSGAHYNPAVTLAIFVRRKISAREMVGYWLAQLVGALAAAFLAKSVFQVAGTPFEVNMVAVVVAEALFTFALVYVVLGVATAKATSGNSFYGFAIAFTVVAGAFTVGKVSAGVFNPAVGLGLGLLGVLSWASLAVYWVTQFVAAAVAAATFRYLHPGE